MIRKYFHKKRTLINVTTHNRWRKTHRCRTIEKAEMQPTSRLELNIGLDAKKMHVGFLLSLRFFFA